MTTVQIDPAGPVWTLTGLLDREQWDHGIVTESEAAFERWALAEPGIPGAASCIPDGIWKALRSKETTYLNSA